MFGITGALAYTIGVDETKDTVMVAYVPSEVFPSSPTSISSTVSSVDIHSFVSEGGALLYMHLDCIRTVRRKVQSFLETSTLCWKTLGKIVL